VNHGGEKTCPDFGAEVHVRLNACACGHAFGGKRALTLNHSQQWQVPLRATRLGRAIRQLTVLVMSPLGHPWQRNMAEKRRSPGNDKPV